MYIVGIYMRNVINIIGIKYKNAKRRHIISQDNWEYLWKMWWQLKLNI